MASPTIKGFIDSTKLPSFVKNELIKHAAYPTDEESLRLLKSLQEDNLTVKGFSDVLKKLGFKETEKENFEKILSYVVLHRVSTQLPQNVFGKLAQEAHNLLNLTGDHDKQVQMVERLLTLGQDKDINTIADEFSAFSENPKIIVTNEYKGIIFTKQDVLLVNIQLLTNKFPDFHTESSKIILEILGKSAPEKFEGYLELLNQDENITLAQFQKKAIDLDNEQVNQVFLALVLNKLDLPANDEYLQKAKESIQKGLSIEKIVDGIKNPERPSDLEKKPLSEEERNILKRLIFNPNATSGKSHEELNELLEKLEVDYLLLNVMEFNPEIKLSRESAIFALSTAVNRWSDAIQSEEKDKLNAENYQKDWIYYCLQRVNDEGFEKKQAGGEFKGHKKDYLVSTILTMNENELEKYVINLANSREPPYDENEKKRSRFSNNKTAYTLYSTIKNCKKCYG